MGRGEKGKKTGREGGEALSFPPMVFGSEGLSEVERKHRFFAVFSKNFSSGR